MAYMSSSNPYYGNPMMQQPQHLSAQDQQRQQQLNQMISVGGLGGLDSNGNNAMGMMGQQQQASQQDGDESMLDEDSKHELALPVDFLPCPNTVIVGRGKKVAQHPGNVRFRAYVKAELDEYKEATTKAHKSSIILRVLTQVRDKSHYAFVKQDLTTGRWCRVEETSQRITTAQAFRDALKDNYKSSRFHKKVKREEEKEAKSTYGEDASGDEEEQEAKEKEAKKPKKQALKKRKAAPKKAEPPAKPMAVESAVPSGAASSSAAAASAAQADQGKAMLDLRKLLEQNQNALMSGQARLWNADAPITLAPAAAAAAAVKREDAKSGNLPKNSMSSVNSRNMNRSLNWSFNGGLGLSNHSTFSVNSNHSFNRGFNANNLNLSNHSNISMSRHSNFSGISNFSGHSTGTFTGLMSKFAPRSGEITANPFEPRPMNHIHGVGSNGSVGSGSLQSGRGSLGSGSAAMDVEMTDVAMGLATARPVFPPRPLFGGSGHGIHSDAHTAAAGIVAAANHPHLHLLQQQQLLAGSNAAAAAAAHHHLNNQYQQLHAAAAGAPLSNLSDHSLMSNFSSIHSRGGFTTEDIFEEMDRSRRRHLQAMLP